MRGGMHVLQVLFAILSLVVITYWVIQYVAIWSQQPELKNIAGQLDLPKGVASFITESVCPEGWSEVSDSAGRLILGVNDKKSIKRTEGKALGDREDRIHYHKVPVSVTVDSKSISAKACCDWVAAKPGDYQSEIITQGSTSGLPFFQLPLCEKQKPVFDNGVENKGLKTIERILYRGSVNFFTSTQCPSGWQAYKPANKRFIIPLAEDGEPGLIVGNEHKLGQAFSHDHSIDLTLPMQETSFIGVDGERDLAKHGAYRVKQEAEIVESLNIPYRTLLACASEYDHRVRVPATFSTFMPRQTCPVGWKAVPQTAGRYLLGLPKDAKQLAAFGGDALLSGQLSSHTHYFRGNLHMEPEAVGLVSGCCNRGFALGQTYSFSGHTSAAVNRYPYVQLLQCMPENI